MFRYKNKIIPVKQGIDYRSLGLRDFDLVLFDGGNTGASLLIKSLEKYELGEGNFSHVGIIITSKSLPFQGLEDGKLYIFESTQSGALTDGVLNVEGHPFLGSQVRDFDQVLKSYDNSADTHIAVRKLVNNPLDTMDINNVRIIMAYLYGKFNHKRYQIFVAQLFEAMFPRLRIFRNKRIEERFVFCSELVAYIYKGFGLLSVECNCGDVVPQDFISKDVDAMVNTTIFHEVQYIRHPSYLQSTINL